MIIDTHSHLNFKAFKNDSDEVIKKTLAEKIWMVNVGTKYETSKQAVELAEKYKKGVYGAIGLHPIHAAEEDYNREKYLGLARSKKVVAIGEIGLDYYYKPKTNIKLEQFKAKQKEVFSQQLDLARELNLPVILHCRMAHQNLIEILKFKIQNSKFHGVIHCFTGSWEEAQEYIKLGFYIGLNGIIFKLDLNEIIKKIPLDKILVETDCPYLTPPQEGAKRNEPVFIKHTIKKIADLKRTNFQEIAVKTTKNARKLFGI